MSKEKYTAQHVIDALKTTKGMIYLAAERLGCHPETIHNYARRYKGVQAEIDNQRGHLVDIAELKLHAAVMDGELGAVKFVLSTIGKSRGYVERSEISGPNGGPVEMAIVKGYATVSPDEWDEDKTDSNL